MKQLNYEYLKKCYNSNINDFDFLRNYLKKQRYHFIGNYAAIKICHWTHKSLVNKIPCYKQKFYGIKSHRCIQLALSPFHCTHRCVYCWRIQPEDIGKDWNELLINDPDEPEEIVKNAIEEQRRIVSGYKGNEKVDLKMYEEARNPKHVAISLAGEPTLYPKLNELISIFKQKGMSTFLVTNGTIPKTLERMDEEPTQLYITIPAPKKEIYEKVCRPLIKNGWEKIMKTLEIVKSFKCPIVFRLTLVKNINMFFPEEYAKIILKYEPTYIEPKAYMHVGYSTLRLNKENMPTHSEIFSFSQILVKYTGYKIIDEKKDSRVTLLSKLDKPIRFNIN